MLPANTKTLIDKIPVDWNYVQTFCDHITHDIYYATVLIKRVPCDCDKATNYTEELIKRFYKEMQIDCVAEIAAEEEHLKYFKEMHDKHIFDAMGESFKCLYDNQVVYLRKLKERYKEKYA